MWLHSYDYTQERKKKAFENTKYRVLSFGFFLYKQNFNKASRVLETHYMKFKNYTLETYNWVQSSNEKKIYFYYDPPHKWT